MKLFYEKYIKLAHIGKGANAHVYQVKHAELGYIRAIKTLNDYIESKSDRAYQSFLKECKTLLAIGNGAHPNIVRIYGPDLIDNHAIVEMDYIQGTTLDSYIKEKGFMDFDEVKTFIHDIVGALAYTHHDIYKFLMNPEEDDLEIDPNDGKKFLISPEKEAELVKKYGIAHNDLHSNNVMRRDYDGSFVLLDFGLAVQDGKCVKSSRMGDGSPEYQAPEKFDSEAVDPRSDVYSLGVLMYELLAGRVPFELEVDSDGRTSQRSINNVLNQHLSATPQPILPLRKEAFEKAHPGMVYERDYPQWLDEIIMKCLAKKPEDRFANAKDLLDAFNTHLKNEKPDSRELSDLKESIAQLNAQYTTEKERNANLYEDWQSAKSENRKLQEQIEALKAEAEKEPIPVVISSVQESPEINDAEIQELRNSLIETENQCENYKKGRKRWLISTIVLGIIVVFVWSIAFSQNRNANSWYNSYYQFKEHAIESGAYNPDNGNWYYSPQTDLMGHSDDGGDSLNYYATDTEETSAEWEEAEAEEAPAAE